MIGLRTVNEITKSAIVSKYKKDVYVWKPANEIRV